MGQPPTPNMSLWAVSRAVLHGLHVFQRVALCHVPHGQFWLRQALVVCLPSPATRCLPLTTHVPAPCLTLLAGSSFGGICTLWACMHYPGRFGAALVESPSLWFADEKFLRCALVVVWQCVFPLVDCSCACG